MKKYYLLYCLLISILWNCRADYDENLPTQNLQLSTELINFNTVFEQLETATQTLTIRNTEDSDIKIPAIYLEKGENSDYHIEVNGLSTSANKLSTILIRKHDSIRIYVKLKATQAPLANYTDRIIIDQNETKQIVNLTAAVEAAEIIDNLNADSYNITQNTTWTAAKSKLIKDDLIIKSGVSLTLDAGTKLYFYADKSLILEKGAQLITQGTTTEKVQLLGNRTEVKYQIPGYWKGIVADENALLQLNHTIIQNMQIGINATQAKLTTQNTEIYNATACGILAENSQLIAENLVVNQAEDFALFLYHGGDYSFTHCTLVNYWQSNVVTDKGGVYISNTAVKNNQYSYKDLKVKCYNTILYSLEGDGLYLGIDSTKSNVDMLFDTNLIQAKTADAVDFNASFFQNTLINKDPKLKQAIGYTQTDLSLGIDSPAINYALGTYALLVPIDILGKNRTTTPDLGAYDY